MSKIIKNNTAFPVEINDIGITIPSNGQYIIPPQDYLLCSDSIDILNLIQNGTVILNDGNSDLSLSDSLAFAKYSNFANSVRFTSTTDLTSVEVNSAINESALLADLALNTPRYAIPLVYNGTVGNNTFIGYSNLVPGDATPIVIPIKSRLIEYTFSNSNASADFTIELIKNSTTNTAFNSESKINTASFVKTGLNELFLSGETIYIKYLDNGTNASDCVIVLFFKAVP